MASSAPSSVTGCSTCGEPLNARGECVACLLRTGLDSSIREIGSPIPLVFGDFEIAHRDDGSLWELGHGAMGVTYLAVDNVLRRKVALKVIDVPAAARISHAVRERFLREARAAAALRHPNVATVFQFGASPDGSHCYYAMELVEGETLETRVRRDGPLNTKLALEIAIQISRALMAAAASGLIHRDLKPSNIMLTRGDADTAELEVKVIDFGLAKAIADAGGEMDLTHGGFVGTPNFASPEQFESGPVDVRSDIYSLGATLWFALTGKTPFAGRNIEEIRSAQKSNVLPIEQLKAARFPSRLTSLLESMLAFEPAARPGIQDLAVQLRRCCALAEIDMAGEVKKEIQLEIAHVLFIDIVGYSKLSINEQHAAVDQLTQIVRATEQFQKGEAAERLIKIAAGDGMALVFYTSPEAPVRCAVELSRALKDHPRLRVRMGIHSGPVRGVVDVTGRTNLAGAGLNLAERVMKCGDAGHILLSKHAAEDLEEYDEWRPSLHHLGTCEVKHGVQIAIVSFWSDDVGNRQLPQKFQALRKQRARVRWAEVAAALLLLAGIAAAFVLVSRKSGTSTSIPPEKSIAVLPFENLSSNADNAYLAEGIQDEILTRLSKIADLKVISRTSTQHYKSAPANLSEIARQLGVANILEGRVQKSGDAVRVNVQLIKAANDSHLWADTFDRKLTDIFSVESEVAKAIANQLRAKLTGQEEQVIAAKPTDNPEAYDAYLRGLAYSLKTVPTPANALGAQKYLREAVRLDPNFALAWALLSTVEARGYLTQNLQPTVALREGARQAAETALALQPNLGEAVLAKGSYHYFCLKDYDTAARYFEQARQFLPNSSRIPESLAYVARRLGQVERSESYFNEAERLDPRNVSLLTQRAISYIVLRRFPEALRKLDQVLDITPDDVDTLVLKAAIAQAEGDLPRAAALLAPLHPNADDPQALETQVYQAILERRPAPVIARLKEILAKPDPTLGFINGELRFWLGWAQEVAGDHAAAQESWRQARNELEPFLKEQPENFALMGDLALVSMGLGDKAAAFRLIERAKAVIPIEKDAKNGPTPIEILARVAARMGEPDRAIAALQKLFSIPYGGALASFVPLTPALLRLDPMFDPLRNDPRFQKLASDASQSPTESALAMPTIPEKSIAVLPFENASNEPNTEYLSEGISEALINSLSELQQLRVIARPTAFRYKGKDVDPRQVGRELGVTAVLTGKVRQMQDALNVQVDLVDAVTGAQIWGAGYDRNIADLVAVKQAIAQEITAKLKLKLSSEEQRLLVKRDSTNAEAYQFYLRGRYFWNKRTSDGIKQAIEHFQQSVERDPNFALGYVGLADSYIGLTFYNFAAPHETMPKAKESAIKALTLDDTLAEAHATLAHVLMNYDWNWSEAEKEFKRSIELRPDYATAHQWYAIHYLTATGRLEEAVQEMKKALELEPASLVMNTFMGATLYYAGRYDEAIDQCRRTIQMDPNFAVAHWHLGLAYEQKQVLDAATEEFKKAISLSGGSPLMKAALGRAYAKSQKKHEANEMLNELNELAKRQYVSAYEVAKIYVALGNNEQAFQLLAKAYAEHSFHFANLNVCPQFKSVRSDPRFQDLVQRVGISR